jgi:eukaryotic-like serine/threonine-protein kinase
MSPEQIMGSAIDSRSDLYSTGALGYFLLTGEPVFTGESMVEVCAHHLHSPVSPPSERLGRPMPPALESLILACLEKDPARRPRDAPALRALLDACHDIHPWTVDDARRWWAEREPVLDSARPAPTGVGATLTIDVRIEQRLPEV